MLLISGKYLWVGLATIGLAGASVVISTVFGCLILGTSRIYEQSGIRFAIIFVSLCSTIFNNFHNATLSCDGELLKIVETTSSSNNNSIIITGLLIVGGVLGYYFLKKKPSPKDPGEGFDLKNSEDIKHTPETPTLDGSIVNKQETGLAGLDKIKSDFAEKVLEKVSRYDSLLKKGSDNLSYQNNDLPLFNLSYLSEPIPVKLTVQFVTTIPQIILGGFLLGGIFYLVYSKFTFKLKNHW